MFAKVFYKLCPFKPLPFIVARQHLRVMFMLRYLFIIIIILYLFHDHLCYYLFMFLIVNGEEALPI